MTTETSACGTGTTDGKEGQPALPPDREGWPYLLVPLIQVAVVLELTHAGATSVFLASALGVVRTSHSTSNASASSSPCFGPLQRSSRGLPAALRTGSAHH
jgi:hypothetical protein